MFKVQTLFYIEGPLCLASPHDVLTLIRALLGPKLKVNEHTLCIYMLAIIPKKSYLFSHNSKTYPSAVGEGSEGRVEKKSI